MESPPRDPGPTTLCYASCSCSGVGWLTIYWYFYVSNYGNLEIKTEVHEAEVQILMHNELKHTSVSMRI